MRIFVDDSHNDKKKVNLPIFRRFSLTKTQKRGRKIHQEHSKGKWSFCGHDDDWQLWKGTDIWKSWPRYSWSIDPRGMKLQVDGRCCSLLASYGKKFYHNYGIRRVLTHFDTQWSTARAHLPIRHIPCSHMKDFLLSRTKVCRHG